MEGGVMESPESTMGSSSTESGESGCCSPKRFPFRLSGLMLMCFIGFGKKSHRQNQWSINYFFRTFLIKSFEFMGEKFIPFLFRLDNQWGRCIFEFSSFVIHTIRAESDSEACVTHVYSFLCSIFVVDSLEFYLCCG